MDGQECLRTPSSYLCSSHLKLYSCYITKFDQVRFEPLCVRSTRSPRFVIDLNLQNIFVHLGLADSSFLVLPSHQVDLGFSISVQPIRTFRSQQVAATACSFASWCHQVVPLDYTTGSGYIYSRVKFWKIFQNPLPAHILLCLFRSPDRPPHRQRPPTAGLCRRQRDSAPPLPP